MFLESPVDVIKSNFFSEHDESNRLAHPNHVHRVTPQQNRTREQQQRAFGTVTGSAKQYSPNFRQRWHPARFLFDDRIEHFNDIVVTMTLR